MIIEIIAPSDGDVKSGRKKSRRTKKSCGCFGPPPVPGDGPCRQLAGLVRLAGAGAGEPDRGATDDINSDESNSEECNAGEWQSRHPCLPQDQQHDVLRIVLYASFSFSFSRARMTDSHLKILTK